MYSTYVMLCRQPQLSKRDLHKNTWPKVKVQISRQLTLASPLRLVKGVPIGTTIFWKATMAIKEDWNLINNTINKTLMHMEVAIRAY